MQPRRPISDSLPSNALKSLIAVIQERGNLVDWWRLTFDSLGQAARTIAIGEILSFLVKNVRGSQSLAHALTVVVDEDRKLFEDILFSFLMPLHEAFVQAKKWDEALQLEIAIYTGFIKQNEDWEFFERAFKRIAHPYNLLARTRVSPKSIVDDSACSQQAAGAKTLFWFQNFNILAHTQLVFEIAETNNVAGSLYASALFDNGMATAAPSFQDRGITLLPPLDSPSYQNRCDHLVESCRQLGITTIVFVSQPLQSGYFREIAPDLRLVWWSMKFPLGGLNYFDQLLCNRTFNRSIRTFGGSDWLCLPIPVHPLMPVSLPAEGVSIQSDMLRAGILSREEKLASSNLPEILQPLLQTYPSLQLNYTGRQFNPALDSRLRGTALAQDDRRLHFQGWVIPYSFIAAQDVIIDTPNLGGLSAYWAMMLGKVVISFGEFGSIGAMGTEQQLGEYFQLLRSTADVDAYFCAATDKPFYLSDGALIEDCIRWYLREPALRIVHGQRFKGFYAQYSSNSSACRKMILDELVSFGIDKAAAPACNEIQSVN